MLDSNFTNPNPAQGGGSPRPARVNPRDGFEGRQTSARRVYRQRRGRGKHGGGGQRIS